MGIILLISTTKKPFHPLWDEKVTTLFVVPPSFRISYKKPETALLHRRNALD
jgi:hypothetical protein